MPRTYASRLHRAPLIERDAVDLDRAAREQRAYRRADRRSVGLPQRSRLPQLAQLHERRRREELGSLDEQRRERVEQAAHFLFLFIFFFFCWVGFVGVPFSFSTFLFSCFSSILSLRFLWTAPI
jgi:hypothetical protein